MEFHKVFIISNNESYFDAIKNAIKLSGRVSKVKNSSIKNLNSNCSNLIKNSKVIVCCDDTSDNYTVLSSIDTNLTKYLVSYCVSKTNSDILHLDTDIDQWADQIQEFLNTEIDKTLFTNLKTTKSKNTIQRKSKYIKVNKYCNIPNTDLNRKLVLEISNSLCYETLNINDEYYGNKNLIYFSVFGSEYLNLLQYCFSSRRGDRCHWLVCLWS